MTALPTLVRRIVRAFGNAPPELAAIADARPDDREAAAAAALGLREKADDERRDAEWSGKDPARIATARRRAGAAHAAVLLTDATSNEAAHLFRTAERIAAAAAWLAFSWEGASFDDELVVARTLVSAWLGKAAEQREDPVNLDTYMRISRPVVTEPVAVAVAEPELVRDAPARGLSLFRTLMDFERLRTPHVTGASQACWRCGAMRRGPITASSLCLACGARLSRNTSPDVASEDESENLSSGSLAAPRPRPMTFMHQASCDACGCTSERWGRPFDMSDMCPICLGMGTLVPC
jgi:hypothetical protein